MNFRKACVWSAWALLPMVVVLLRGGSWLGLVYLAAAAVSYRYHQTNETQLVDLDHVMAYTAICANGYLTWHSQSWPWTAAGCAGIGLALWFYFLAHLDEKRRYDKWHTHWHLATGAAGLCLALGYTGGFR